MGVHVVKMRIREVESPQDVDTAKFMSKNGFVLLGTPADDRRWLSGKTELSTAKLLLIEAVNTGVVGYVSIEDTGFKTPTIKVRACAVDPGMSEGECELVLRAALGAVEAITKQSRYGVIVDVAHKDVETRQVLGDAGWEALQPTAVPGTDRYYKGYFDETNAGDGDDDVTGEAPG